MHIETTTNRFTGRQSWFYRKFGKKILHNEWDKPAEVDRDGSKFYLQHGKFSRGGDKPAIELADGTRIYFVDGKKHRIGGPAVNRPDGSFEYFVDGKKHRVGGVAVRCADGTEEYWQNGLQHNEEGPWKVWPNGDREFRFHGALHNWKGPAIDKDGKKVHSLFGQLHNYEGPSVEEEGVRKFHLHGVELSEEEFLDITDGRTPGLVSARFYIKRGDNRVYRHVRRVLKALQDVVALARLEAVVSMTGKV